MSSKHMGKAVRRRMRELSRPVTFSPLEVLVARARKAAEAGQADVAIPLYVEAIQKGSASADVFNDLGALLAGHGRIPAAVLQFEVALFLAPRDQAIRRNLLAAVESTALSAFGERRWTDAAAGFVRLSELDPDCATFHTNAGAALRELKLHEQSLPHFRRACELTPQDPRGHFNLGTTLLALARAECQVEFERAIELNPGYADAHVNLSLVYNRLGQLARSAAGVRRALEIAPDHVQAHAALAAVLREQGEREESLEHYRRALECRPDSPSIYSGYLLARQADPEASPEVLSSEHRAWASRFADPIDPGPGSGFDSRDRDPERCLRVGYVSADFRSHSVASFIEPILAAHDRNVAEVHCYSDAVPDAVTERIRAAAAPGIWHDVRTLTDQALVAQVAADRIDVLVDLAGHTGDNRLLCFARRPAPVQVTYLGYPSTTGISAMGWRLTDAVSDPEGVSDRTCSEALWRLPNGFLCFRPDPSIGLPGPLPAQKRGFITFGSFNNLSKMDQGVIELWAEILRAAPQSKLLLKSRALSDAGPRTRLCRAFETLGVDSGRLEVAAYAATPQEHVKLYDQVDIALDPFPYGGTTTTCEALWMGVPVVTLSGNTHPGRVGASLLTRIGCPEMIASTRADYVAIALALACEPGRLGALRRALRGKMVASPLTNPAIITRDIETAYRSMWRRWCRGP